MCGLSPDRKVNNVDKYSFMYGVALIAADKAASTAWLSAMYEAGSSFLDVSTLKNSYSLLRVRSFAGFLKYASSNFLASTLDTSTFSDVAMT